MRKGTSCDRIAGLGVGKAALAYMADELFRLMVGPYAATGGQCSVYRLPQVVRLQGVNSGLRCT